MSSVAFNPSNQNELEKLREAWKSLNDLLKNITNAEACRANHDLKLTADHLKVANLQRGLSRLELATTGYFPHQCTSTQWCPRLHRSRATGGTPWLKFDCETDNIHGPGYVCGAGIPEDKAILAIGLVSFAIKVRNELAGTEATLFAGKA